MRRWLFVLMVFVSGCSSATQTPFPTATNTRTPTATVEPTATSTATREPLDRAFYIAALQRMSTFVDGELGVPGITERDGQNRTAMIHYTLNSAPVREQLLDVFDALAAIIRLNALELDAGTVLMEVDGEIALRATAQIGDLLPWYNDEIEDDVFIGRLEVVNLLATHEAQATASAQP